MTHLLRRFGLAVAVLVLLAGAAGQARAGLIYTWHEDDSQQGVSGQIDVLATAQAAGQITLQDIQSFSFSTAGLNFNTTARQSWNQRQLPYPDRPRHRGILRPPPEFFGPLTATPPSPPGSIFPNIRVSASADSMNSGGGIWGLVTAPNVISSGQGHWLVSAPPRQPSPSPHR